jgi:DNA-binding LytR/AlgR family response regulator
MIEREEKNKERVALLIREAPFLELIQTCSTAGDALPLMQQHRIDVLFLNRQIPDLMQPEFLKKVKQQSPTLVFTNDMAAGEINGNDLHNGYAPKKFDLDAYMLMMNRLFTNFQQLSQAQSLEKPERKFIFVRTEYKIVKVILEEILFIEGVKDYTKLHLSGDRHLLTLRSLKSFGEILPAHLFVRIHRSYIVSLNHVDTILRNRVMVGKHSLPLSNSYKDPFFDTLQLNA